MSLFGNNIGTLCFASGEKRPRLDMVELRSAPHVDGKATNRKTKALLIKKLSLWEGEVKAEFAALDDASRHGKRGEFLVGRIGGLSHAIQLIRADGKGDIIR